MPSQRQFGPKKKPDATLLLVLAGVAAVVVLLGCAGIATLIYLPRAAPQLEAMADANIMSSIADAPNRPDWTADDDAVAQLGSYVRFDKYAMRLPLGYLSGTQGHAVNSQTPDGGTKHNWQWLQSASGNPLQSVVYAQLQKAPTTVNGAEYFEQQLPHELKQRRKSNSGDRFEYEAGRVDGKRCVRVTSYSPKEGLAHISIYRFEGSRLLCVGAICSSSDRQLLRLLETSLLTVHEYEETGSDSQQSR